jgi:hypothetical protein
MDRLIGALKNIAPMDFFRGYAVARQSGNPLLAGGSPHVLR